VKHATDEALDALTSLLREVRALALLREKKRGVFYLKSKAFLHFHEDPKGLFADLRTGSQWRRLQVTTRAQQKTLLAKVRSVLRQEMDG
jgi:hypothetical protein